MSIYRPGIRPRRRHERGVMNKVEHAYAEVLAIKAHQQEILCARFECVKLRLADDTTFTPDFFVTYPDHFEFHEVKPTKKVKGSGREIREVPYFEEDARIKVKIAAEQYPEFLFVTVWKTHEGWQREEFR